MRFFLPIILIGIAIASFLLYVSPTYTNIKSLQSTLAQYDTALSNSKVFESEREKLNSEFQAISSINLDKLTTLLPDSVDNIRLILELDNIASVYGMNLQDVKYSTDAITANSTTNSTSTTAITTPAPTKQLQANAKIQKDYGEWDLEFSTTGTYSNFLSFLNDLEHNLRIVDVISVDFSSVTPKTLAPGVVLDTTSTQNYKYNFKIKTYWLKN